MKSIALALLALVLIPATVFAGGGSKNSTEFEFKNTSADIALVIVDTTMSNADLAALPDLAAFTAKGGIVLNPGAGKVVKVKAGSHSVKAVLIPANGSALPVEAEIATKSVNAVANKRTTVKISGAVGAQPTIN